jgi:beta-hydroxylase
VQPLFLAELKAQFAKIQTEWNTYAGGENSIKPIDDISEDQKQLNEKKKWDALVLYAYGHKNEKVILNFQSVNSIIDKYPMEIQMVMFSILKPGMHIPPHTGNSNHVLRAQTVIENKQAEKTNLRIENDNFRLQTGDSIVFDDTFEHEAWNNSTTNRVALIIDFKKPFPFIISHINSYLLRRFAKSAYVTSVVKKW